MGIKHVECAMSLASMSGHSKGRCMQCHWQVYLGIANVKCMQYHWHVCLGITKVAVCNVIGKYVWALQR